MRRRWASWVWASWTRFNQNISTQIRLIKLNFGVDFKGFFNIFLMGCYIPESRSKTGWFWNCSKTGWFWNCYSITTCERCKKENDQCLPSVGLYASQRNLLRIARDFSLPSTEASIVRRLLCIPANPPRNHAPPRFLPPVRALPPVFPPHPSESSSESLASMRDSSVHFTGAHAVCRFPLQLGDSSVDSAGTHAVYDFLYNPAISVDFVGSFAPTSSIDSATSVMWAQHQPAFQRRLPCVRILKPLLCYSYFVHAMCSRKCLMEHCSLFCAISFDA